jgi:histidine ammonia-lyase
MGRVRKIIVGTENPLTVDDVNAVAAAGAKVELTEDPAFRDRIAASRQVLEDALKLDGPIYGVRTGFGQSCGNRIEAYDSIELGNNLVRYHRCGVGPFLPETSVRAAMMCRLACLAQGMSGVRWELLERLRDFLNLGLTPVVPSRGSVGASGDLTPMAYIAATLIGEHDLVYEGRPRAAADGIAEAGLAPFSFAAKEALAVLNGTSIMTGLAAETIGRAQRFGDAAIAATALSVHALAGHAAHFGEPVFRGKPHRGSVEFGERIRSLLETVSPPPEADAPGALQDTYAVRCAPQVVGVLHDTLTWARDWVETEINSANDNPLCDPRTGEVWMGGNFYGGHVAAAMDALKSAVASTADMLDRQVALLVDPRFNRGLPENLVMVEEGNGRHHGFKGMQITASALTAEALKATMPAAAFSRSTESHNQDKVSMGTIAARDAVMVCELSEQVAAIAILAAAQGCQLRGGLDTRPALAAIVERLRRHVPANTADRAQDVDIDTVAELLRRAALIAEGGP